MRVLLGIYLRVILSTYVDGNAGRWEYPGRRRLLRYESIEFLLIEVPFDGIQKSVLQVVVAY